MINYPFILRKNGELELKEMDATKFDKELQKIAESFLKAPQETEQLLAKQKLALCAFHKK